MTIDILANILPTFLFGLSVGLLWKDPNPKKSWFFITLGLAVMLKSGAPLWLR